MRLHKAVAWYLKLKNALMLITKKGKELSLGHILKKQLKILKIEMGVKGKTQL